MKNLLISILLFAALSGYSQSQLIKSDENFLYRIDTTTLRVIKLTKQTSNFNLKLYQGFMDKDSVRSDRLYVDSLQTKSILITDPQDLKDVSLKTGADLLTNKKYHKLYITLNNQPHCFMSIPELTAYCVPHYTKKAIIYFLDDNLVKNIDDMSLDATFIRNVTLIKGAQIGYFRGALENVLLFMINTKDAPKHEGEFAHVFTLK